MLNQYGSLIILLAFKQFNHVPGSPIVKIGGHAKHFQDSNGNIKDHNPMLLVQHYQHGFSSITEVPS